MTLFRISHLSLASLLICLLLCLLVLPGDSPACCAVAPNGGSVVNADQTVLILWDPETKMQHFVRQATFQSDSKRVGFIVPSPSRPELDESGDAVFAKLKQLTAPPPTASDSGRPGLGCSASKSARPAAEAVRVVERKRVAGFDAVVLQADRAADLIAWLKQNDYANSPELTAWAQPYVQQKWFFVALKVADGETPTIATENNPEGSISAAALRISFKTDKPLFPYREPASTAAAKKLGADDRLLRIYVITDQACAGAFDVVNKAVKWNGEVKWCGDITVNKAQLLDDLGLPADAGPKKWMLTEFENNWPYAAAPADVVFTPNKKQKKVRRTAAIDRSSGVGLGWAPVAFAMVLVFGMRRFQMHDR